MGFHDLEMRGNDKNSGGFFLRDFRLDGQSYRLVVQNARLWGIGHSGTISGKTLTGAQIVIERDSPQGLKQYAIRVTAVDEIAIAVPPNDPRQPPTVETYELDYGEMFGQQPPSEWKNVCGNVPFVHPDPEFVFNETHGLDPKNSILFEGDKIDLETMTIDQTWQPKWFNIGCSGHTLAKLFMTRNTTVSQGQKNPAQYQATLKLLVADYSGLGHPFTVAGQALTWTGGQVQYFRTPTSSEALWDEHGAICLDTPRMTNPSTEAGAKEYPDIEQAIRDSGLARPPPCATPDPLRSALRFSGNY
ncbi:MAG: ADYC domain-containing protein [Kofleriaceae bacterium]